MIGTLLYAGNDRRKSPGKQRGFSLFMLSGVGESLTQMYAAVSSDRFDSFRDNPRCLPRKGDVDDQFDKFKVYRNVEKASEHLKQVELYCLEVNREISELESYSKLAKINFLEASKIARSIKARSIWIGAQHVKKASFFVIDACLGFHEESYSQAVDGLRNDFEYTKKKFETYLKMVREVIEKEKQEKTQKK